MRTSLIFIIILGLTISACKKDSRIGDKEFVTLSYQQTYCSDPWETGSSDSLTLVQVAGYLQAADILISGLSIKPDGTEEFCYACSCKTGNVIYLSTLNSEALKEKLKRIGFE
jgi:hypothetical protein